MRKEQSSHLVPGHRKLNWGWRMVFWLVAGHMVDRRVLVLLGRRSMLEIQGCTIQVIFTIYKALAQLAHLLNADENGNIRCLLPRFQGFEVLVWKSWWFLEFLHLWPQLTGLTVALITQRLHNPQDNFVDRIRWRALSFWPTCGQTNRKVSRAGTSQYGSAMQSWISWWLLCGQLVRKQEWRVWKTSRSFHSCWVEKVYRRHLVVSICAMSRAYDALTSD